MRWDRVLPLPCGAWGRETGPHTAEFVERLLGSRLHPEQGYRNCLGLPQRAQQVPRQVPVERWHDVAIGLSESLVDIVGTRKGNNLV